MSKEFKIPSILGLVLLFGGIVGGYILTNHHGANTITKASGDCQPINPQITNITDKSAVISFTTESICPVIISLNDQIYQDKRVISGQEIKSKIHYFELNNLKEASDLTFIVISDGKKYENSNYKINTANKINQSVPSSRLAWGRVFTSDLKPASEAIVYLNIPGAYPLSALVTSSGNWDISLATSLNQSKTNWFTAPSNIDEEIIVIAQDQPSTQITGNTSRNNSVPDIIIGQNSFSSTPVDTSQLPATGSLNSVTPVTSSKQLDILNPKDNENLSTKKPDFFGTGPVNSKVKIEVHSTTVYNGEVTTNNDGSWNWSAPSDLTPGEHTITATTIENGITKTISRKFVVLAADNSTSFSASSSATTPTPTPTPKVTATPTTKITPTLIPTVVPTITVTSSRTTRPSTSSGVPVTGNFIPTIILIVISSFFLFASVLFFKK